MNNKLIIQIIVIVGAFVGAGLVLYNGLFKQSGPPPAVISTTVTTQQAILPYGTSMDFDGVLYQRNLQYNLVAFPVLNSQSDVGINPANLITPIIPAAPQKK